MSISIEEIHPFITPVFRINLADIDNDSLIKELNEIMQKNKGRVVSNVGGYQSSDIDILDAPENLFTTANKVLEICNEIYNHYSVNQKIVIQNFWFNINKYKDYNTNHVHHVDGLAAVYYVKCNDNSGNLIFQRPGPEIFTERDTPPFFNPFYEVAPKNGDLFIFPSNLDHSVGPNLSDEDRISIAFNLGRE